MKKFLTLSVMVLTVAGMIFTGCKKESEPKANEFTIGDETVAIDTMELEYYGAYGDGYEYWLDLLSPSITVSSSGYWGNSGKILDFNLISSSSDGVASGTYTYNTTGTAVSTFFTSDYCLNWVYGSSNNWIEITSGTLDVIRDGNNYEVTFTGEDENGETVTAYYKGVGCFFDWSKKSTASNR